MRIYVCGPVTGREGLNRAEFESARLLLESVGHSARVPHDFVPAGASHARAMRMCLGYLLRCVDGVALLPGWQESEGAALEERVARAVGVECRPVEGWVTADGG